RGPRLQPRADDVLAPAARPRHAERPALTEPVRRSSRNGGHYATATALARGARHPGRPAGGAPVRAPRAPRLASREAAPGARRDRRRRPRAAARRGRAEGRRRAAGRARRGAFRRATADRLEALRREPRLVPAPPQDTRAPERGARR